MVAKGHHFSGVELAAVIDASRSAALAEDHAIFNGYANGGIIGIAPSSPHESITITDDYGAYPTQVAKAFAGLDRISGGRVGIHIISGGNDAEQRAASQRQAERR